MLFTLDQLRENPRNWLGFRGYGDSDRYYGVPWHEILPIAFEYLDQLVAQKGFDSDDASWPCFDCALGAIERYCDLFPDKTFDVCRGISQYFFSCNIDIACRTIRLFEYGTFSRFIMFVSDQLISIAACQTPLQSPGEMTARGFAFRVLFKLDPGYKFWPSLRSAREECIQGLLAWGERRPEYRVQAQMIRQYTDCAK